ncbi:hypothetical protein HanRHA438_Chr16g0774971 [Helianthus annuus]|nr:hypothetical protein HanRHA438_Chr16g0774971 [Helianthus annuus]
MGQKPKMVLCELGWLSPSVHNKSRKLGCQLLNNISYLFFIPLWINFNCL